MKRMKNQVRRMLAGVLSLLALSLPLTAAADETSAPEASPSTAPTEETAYTQVSEKTITFTADDQIAIEPEGQTAFWEYPLLLPGENRQPGTLRLVNASSKAINFQLEIGLPYENTLALTYLNALRITVKEGDTVLYDGAYCHIADEQGGLQVSMENWQPGSERVLTIQLRCDFGYDGDPEQVSAPINWGAKVRIGNDQGGASSADSSPNLQTPRPVTAVIIIGVAGSLVVICAVAGAVGVILRRRKGRQPPEDNTRE